jgi:hypothetical protein
MSERRLFGLLSGAHVTAIVCAAILGPSAGYAALEFVNVALVNPSSGVSANIDTAQRLWVYDSIAGYRNYPGNLVDIRVQDNGNQCETSEQYVVPSGSAFVITALSGFSALSTDSSNNVGFTIFSGANCTGNPLADRLATASQSAPYVPVEVEYGAGIPVPAGSTISVFSQTNTGFTYIHGYLVPAGTIKSGFYQGSVPKR